MAYFSYRSFNDLNNAIFKTINKIPRDIDLIVGIPRSGMLPANLIALYLQKPFTDIDSFIEGKIYSSGERGKKIPSSYKKILLIDDSINSGQAKNKALNKIEKINKDYEILYGAVYATPDNTHLVDYYAEIIESPRIFQWNVLNHSYLEKACFDMDGVLCEDPKIDDDGPLYIKEITEARPKFIPKVKIGTIVTCRLEKYREITENWLSNNGVMYNELIMLPFKTKDERIKWGKHGEYKAEIYKNLPDSLLFIESEKNQANLISKISGKTVFCIENFDIINSSYDTIKKNIKINTPNFGIKLYRKFKNIIKKIFS